jgi:hypothetical protein
VNRRGFFSRIASAALAGVIIPREKLVIEPVYKLFLFTTERCVFPSVVEPETGAGAGISIRYQRNFAPPAGVRYDVRGPFFLDGPPYE